MKKILEFLRIRNNSAYCIHEISAALGMTKSDTSQAITKLKLNEFVQDSEMRKRCAAFERDHTAYEYKTGHPADIDKKIKWRKAVQKVSTAKTESYKKQTRELELENKELKERCKVLRELYKDELKKSIQ